MREEIIGSARLILGDCRDVLPTLGVFDFCFTDPPYGHNNNNGDLIANREQALGKKPNGVSRPILNDGIEANDLVQWFFKEIPNHLWPGSCCCCCCGGGGPDPQFARWSLWLDQHLDFKQMVVWDKGPIGMGWHYRRSYETILVGQKKGAACRWFSDRQDIENIIRPGYAGIKKIIPQQDDHPTPKPPELARHFIRLHTTFGQSVLDPFMGGCSTGVAAILEGRSFTGIELDPEYFDASCRRIEAAQRQADLFVTQPPPMKHVQETML